MAKSKPVEKRFSNVGDFPKTNDGQPYIHLDWRSYVDRSTFQNETNQWYKTYAEKKRRDFRKAVGMPEKDAEALMEKVATLYDIWEDKGGIEKETMDAARNAVADIKNANPEFFKNQGHAIANDVSKMNSVLKGLKRVFNGLDKFNKIVVKGLSQPGMGSLTGMQGQDMKKFQFVEMDNKTRTSVANMKAGVEAIEAVMDQFQLPMTIEYDKAETKKGVFTTSKTTSKVSSVMYATRQRLINTQGFLLEAAGWMTLNLSIKNGLLDELKKEGVKVSAEIQGDQMSELGKTKKTDVGIVLEKDGDSKYRVNLGFSAKATMKETTKKITYGTYNNMMLVYQQARILNQIQEYYFNNLIAARKWQDAGYLNRLIAAKSALSVVGGSKGDEIYFLMYLDKIMRIDQFYDSMGDGNEVQLALDVVAEKGAGISSIKEYNKKVDGDDAVLAAFERSRRVNEAIRSLGKVQVILDKNK